MSLFAHILASPSFTGFTVIMLKRDTVRSLAAQAEELRWPEGSAGLHLDTAEKSGVDPSSLVPHDTADSGVEPVHLTVLLLLEV